MIGLDDIVKHKDSGVLARVVIVASEEIVEGRRIWGDNKNYLISLAVKYSAHHIAAFDYRKSYLPQWKENRALVQCSENLKEGCNCLWVSSDELIIVAPGFFSEMEEQIRKEIGL